MLEIKLDRQFKKDVKRDKKSGRYDTEDFKALKKVMDTLIDEEKLDDRYLAHNLIGNFHGYSECHVKPNWLLVYKQTQKSINFARLGTHQQLFE